MVQSVLVSRIAACMDCVRMHTSFQPGRSPTSSSMRSTSGQLIEGMTVSRSSEGGTLKGTLLNPTSGSLKRDPIERVYIPKGMSHANCHTCSVGSGPKPYTSTSMSE